MVRDLLREPLVHFLVLGAAIFSLFSAVDDTPAIAPDRIEVTQADMARLERQFEATWRRPPTAEELGGLVEAHLREEVLVREAVALGLDRDDAVIRQRLAQKMRFLIESGAEAIAPTEADLAAHLATFPERFEEPARLGFEQVPLPRDAAAGEVLAALRTGTPPDAVLDASLLPPRVPPSPEPIVDGTFGAGFFAALSEIETGGWTGPVESAYGRHLVRILGRTPARLPPLAEIRDRVERDWRASARERLAEERFEALAARYDIVRPGSTALSR